MQKKVISTFQWTWTSCVIFFFFRWQPWRRELTALIFISIRVTTFLSSWSCSNALIYVYTLTDNNGCCSSYYHSSLKTFHPSFVICMMWNKSWQKAPSLMFACVTMWRFWYPNVFENNTGGWWAFWWRWCACNYSMLICTGEQRLIQDLHAKTDGPIIV